MLKIESLGKNLGEKVALSNINLELDSGIYSLLGDNGAGKSTLMRILVDVDKLTSGQIYYQEEDISQLKEKYRSPLGYIPQEFIIFPRLTAYEFLTYIGALKGLSKARLREKIPQVLSFVNLEDIKDRKVPNFSGGMKRRVGIAQIILNDPKILILDEPTVGLDPGGRIQFSDILFNMSRNKIILFSTYIVSDIEAITKNIIILDDRRIRAKTTSDILADKISGRIFEKYIPFQAFKIYDKKIHITRIRYEEKGLKIRYTGELLGNSVSVEAISKGYYILHKS